MVDAHCHLWDRRHQIRSWPDAPPPLARSFTVEDLERSCAGNGVVSVVLIEAGMVDDEAALLEANAAAASIVGAFVAFADPIAHELGPLLDRLMRQPKFRGVRMRFEGRPAADLEDPRVIRSVREIAERGLVLDLLVTTEHLEAVHRLASAVPDLHGIIDHMAKPDVRGGSDGDRWRALVGLIATETALLFKVSLSPRAPDLPWLAHRPAAAWPAERLRPYLETLLEVVGPDRLAWGSDWPVGVFGGDHGRAVATITAALGPIDSAVEDLLFRSTATAFYRLA